MKKGFSILICYAVGMVASSLGAIGVVTSNDFSDNRLWGMQPVYGLTERGELGTTEKTYWYYFGEWGNASVITNYEPGAMRYSGFTPSNPKPDYMQSGADNTGLVDVRARGALMRTFKPARENGASSVVAVPYESDGLFVDALVRFYPRLNAPTEVPDVDMDGKAKFMCWLSAPEGSSATNFVITAGRYAANGSLYRVNYVTTAKVEAGRWYRLTARLQYNSATQHGRSASCFGLYLDGEPVVCGDDYAIGDDASATDAKFAGNELYSRHALYPPVREFSKPGLMGFAVQGRGHFDELAVVNDGNPLTRQVPELTVAVSMDPNKVTNVTCAVTSAGAGAPSFTTNASHVAEVLLTVAPGDSVHVDCLTAEGFSRSAALSLLGNVAAVAEASGYDFTMRDEGLFESADRLVARIDVGGAYFRVGEMTYESVAEAIEAAAADPSKTVALASEVTLDPETDNGQFRVLPTYEIVLDLCGRHLKGEHFQNEATIYNQGRLTVLDSVGGGVIEAPGAPALIEVEVSTNDAVEVNHTYAALQLGSVKAPNDFKVKGRVRVAQGALELQGGSYLTPADLEPTNGFYLAEYVGSNRFSVEGPTAVPGEGKYWRVVYDGRLKVRFESDLGTPDPQVTNVVTGAKLVEPTIAGAAGYTLTGWFVKGTDEVWDFAAGTVTEDLTLVARHELAEYSIAYDLAVPPGSPERYSVTEYKRQLPTDFFKAHFTFGGWRDANTGRVVAEVGRTATFVGTDIPVTGDLDLKAIWVADVLKWTNADVTGGSESNGVYAGSWTMTLPVRDDLPEGTAVKIDAISFCIVNPLLYPKTAARLSVQQEGSTAVLSAAREFVVDPETSEYLVTAEDRLTNGRAKVAYLFDALTVRVGETYAVRFATSGGAATGGFLRLKLTPRGDDPVFGNCSEAGGTLTPKSEAYLDYCPVYEVSGHVEGGAGE